MNVNCDTQKVYYDTETHGFRTIREQTDSGFSVSKPCDYYEDAKSTICTMVISGKYIDRNFIDPEPMDLFEFAELCPLVRSYRTIERAA